MARTGLRVTFAALNVSTYGKR